MPQDRQPRRSQLLSRLLTTRSRAGSSRASRGREGTSLARPSPRLIWRGSGSSCSRRRCPSCPASRCCGVLLMKLRPSNGKRPRPQPAGWASLQSLEVKDPKDFPGAFSAMTRKRPDALLTFVSPLTTAYRPIVVEFATKHRLPTMFAVREDVGAGGLMSYAANVPHIFRRAAGYVDKILKGTKAGDLPIEQPTEFELVINLKTAKALGLTIPQTVLLRADQVIE